VTSPPKPVEASYHSGFGSSSSDSIDNARFTPGTMLADRYRIVGLLGKGGMGEVYRADDLKLRQPVALKFLPEALSKDPKKLERFLHEVRVARQVSHPNVCRVYDISEADGQHFISMEYVDGEDLSAVLRRMGRPSKEKALQIARQLCAGLAAAHDKGVLHRDLKPHNVMIDGQGRVRITDFGLAGFAEDFTGKEVYAGTPAYMAPEQLAGRGVSVKSDIYSLGVVLSELFTGKRLFEGTSREQLQRSGTSAPTRLSTLTDDLDPAVERVILRCLEPDPTARPSSALAVAAALPGGDPLAAALAAGQTPSPEMVANAGDVGGMKPVIAVACLIAILGGTFALVPLSPNNFSLARLVSMPKPPAALADRAAEILTKLGHKGPVVDTAYGFNADGWRMRHVEDTNKSLDRWKKISEWRPSPVRFWYRTSPRLLIPPSSDDRVGPWTPPLEVSGMTTVFLDPQGRLTGLAVDPPQREDEREPSAPAKPTDWSVLFAEAQIDPTTFTVAEPRWTPDNYCDERAAWEGHFPTQPDIPIRIEAGAYRGVPTFLHIIGPWTKPQRMEEWPQTLGQKIGGVIILSVLISLVIGGALLARRNLKLRRSDRAGADRLALACFFLMLVSSLLLIDHVPDFGGEFDRLFVLVGKAMVAVAVMWLWYIALEPYVRRRWSHALISWSRLLAGRFRDPLVGRDILVGGVFALTASAVIRIGIWVSLGFGEPSSAPMLSSLLLLGPRFQIGSYLDGSFVFSALLILILLLSFRLILRKEWLAYLGVFVLQAVLVVVDIRADQPLSMTLLSIFFGALVWSVFVLVPMRFGLLASVFFWFFFGILGTPVRCGLTGWQSEASWTAILFITAVTVYGFHTALAGRPLFRDELAV
jgi:serine/threonine-protein kinase